MQIIFLERKATAHFRSNNIVGDAFLKALCSLIKKSRLRCMFINKSMSHLKLLPASLPFGSQMRITIYSLSLLLCLCRFLSSDIDSLLATCLDKGKNLLAEN